MGTGFETLKRVVLAVTWLGMVFAIWRYLAHFNVVQSVLLTLLAFYVIGQMTSKTEKGQMSNFSPFWVRIEPNWYSICSDFGLAAGEKVERASGDVQGRSNRVQHSPQRLQLHDVESDLVLLERPLHIFRRPRLQNTD